MYAPANVARRQPADASSPCNDVNPVVRGPRIGLTRTPSFPTQACPHMRASAHRIGRKANTWEPTVVTTLCGVSLRRMGVSPPVPSEPI
jgi:hypothetical protein